MIENKDEAFLLNEKYNGEPTAEFENDKERLNQGEPLAYVIGNIPFLNTTIYLDSKPLIPRVESEYWLEEALKETDDSPKKVLDIFSGSGALGIAWAKARPQDTITFAEIDEAHLNTIRKNITANNIQNPTTVIQSDVWSNITDTYDIILANPPYVPKDRDLPKGVIMFEPLIALFAGEDGLIYIKTFIESLPEHVNPNATIYIEHDKDHDLGSLFPDSFTTQRRTDQYGVYRYTVAHYS